MSVLGQFGIILAFGLCGEIAANILPFSFPSGVIALLLLFAAVRSGALPENKIRQSADFLQANMAFFFLPSAVNIIQSYPRIRAFLFPMLLICLVSTICTFAASYAATRFVKNVQNLRKKTT